MMIRDPSQDTEPQCEICQRSDILEISLFSYLVDAILGAPPEVVVGSCRSVFLRGERPAAESFVAGDILLASIRMGLRMRREPN